MSGTVRCLPLADDGRALSGARGALHEPALAAALASRQQYTKRAEIGLRGHELRPLEYQNMLLKSG